MMQDAKVRIKTKEESDGHHKVRRHHHGGHNAGRVTLGAAVVGGLVGGLLGACQ